LDAHEGEEMLPVFAATRHEHVGIEYASSVLVHQRLDSLLLLLEIRLV
jgi:hypothetical protein